MTCQRGDLFILFLLMLLIKKEGGAVFAGGDVCVFLAADRSELELFYFF